MIIRAAIEADAGAIADIWNAAIDNTAITFTTQRKTVGGISKDIRTRGAGFQVAEAQGVLAGFATLFPFRSGPGYRHTMEHTIQLSPHAQGKGIGRRLMKEIEFHAKQNGVHSIFAGVSGENPDGIAFHTALGFREVARLPEVGFKFGRWMDLVLMQKFL